MAFIPVPGIAEVAIRQELFEQQVVNTVYFANLEPNIQVYSNLAAALFSWVEDQLYQQLSNNLALREISIRDLSVQDGPQLVAPSPSPIIGALGLASLPGNVAACVSFRTGLTGRSRRGRNYIAGIPETSVLGNRLEAVLGSSLFAAYAGLSTAVAATGAVWAVVSRYTNNAPRPAGIFTPVASVLVDANVDSQRRRLNGRGR